jgi:hypothetical protein
MILCSDGGPPFAIGWPIAASTAYLAIPFARSFTQHIVAAIERTV